MYSKAVLLAFLATIAIVYAQEVERQTSLADVNDDTALLEADGAPVTREKRFLLAKKKLAIGLGVGGVVGFVKGYKLGKLSNYFGRNSGGGYAPSYGSYAPSYPSYQAPAYQAPAYQAPSYPSVPSVPSYQAPSYQAPSYHSAASGPSYEAPSYNTQHYHYHTYTPQSTYGVPNAEYQPTYTKVDQQLPHATYGAPSFNDYYTENKPSSYDTSNLGAYSGQKSVVIGGQWSAGIAKNGGYNY